MTKTTVFNLFNPIIEWTDPGETSASYFPDSAIIMLTESK